MRKSNMTGTVAGLVWLLSNSVLAQPWILPQRHCGARPWTTHLSLYGGPHGDGHDGPGRPTSACLG